jgi:hypothetical protein
MKRSFFTLLVCCGLFAAQSAIAQKYKIKDASITKDKVVVGSFIGDAGFQKTNLQIFGTNGEKVLTVTEGRFSVKNPFFDYIYWYNVKFEDTGKTLKLDHAGNCGEKCFINNVLVPNGIMLEGSIIKDQDAIISKEDISQRLNTDTTVILEKHNLWMKLLEKNTILRDKEKQVVLIKDSESANADVTTTVFNVVQDNIIVGKIIKYHTQSSTQISTTYSFFEKLYQPEGTMTEVPAGKVTDTFMDLVFVTLIDGKEHKMRMDDKANAQNALATYLVSKGYF